MVKPHPWRSLYYSLAAAGLVVCAAFAPILSAVHLAVMAALVIAAPLGLAWLGGRLDEEFEPPPVPRNEPRRRAAWFAATLFGISAAKFLLLGWVATEFVPSLHDEWSYLFGAETFALGRLSNPTPPHAEF